MSAAARAADLAIAWDPSSSSGVTGYVISYGTQSGNYTTRTDVGNQTSQTLTGLSVGTTYYVVVQAYTSNGSLSSPSNELVTQPPSNPLAIVCSVPSVSSPSGAAVPITFTPTVSGGQGATTTTCTPPSGSLFPVGTTSVTCVVSDATQQTASCNTQVVVTSSSSNQSGNGGASTTPTTFSTATSGTSSTVPAGVTTVTVKAWGGAGGADGGDGRFGGGGGGFAQADITVTPGETLAVRVGGGGARGTNTWQGGGGGGYSGVFRSSTPLVIAAGGGGGAGNGPGGVGGGANGGVGGGFAGNGGSQVQGGLPGTSNGVNDVATAGTSLTGGHGGGRTNGSGDAGAAGGLNGGGRGGSYGGGLGRTGGGGGGGFYGGGGGAGDAGNNQTGGGGGGSSYLSGVNTTTLPGSGILPGNMADSLYVGSAGQGNSRGAGMPGLVVLIPASPSTTPNTPNTTPSNGNVVNVSSVSQLANAVSNLTSNTTIVIAPGTYNVTATLALPQNISQVTIKGSTGNRDDVVIQGPGMTSSVLYGFWIGNVQAVTFQDLTVKGFGYHDLIFNQGAQSPQLINLHLLDAGEQIVKVNPLAVNNGLVQNSLIEFSTQAPGTYTNGLDIINGAGWVIRGNTFRNIKSSAGLAGPALLIWGGSSNITVEKNVFVDNQRDIAFGLDPAMPSNAPMSNPNLTDNSGGVISNNFIVRNNVAGADVGIGVFDSPNTKVYYNTVLIRGGYSNAMEYRFPRTTGVDIRDNLTDAFIYAREGATATVANNVTTASLGLFVNPSAADLHLLASATAARGVGAAVSVVTDIDGDARPSVPDVGADQYVASSTTGAPTLTCPTVPSATSANGNAIAVSFGSPVVSGGTAPVTTSCVPASGSLFPVGTTPVTCVAADAAQRNASCTTNVVVSTPAPAIACPTIPAATSSDGNPVAVTFASPVVTGGATPLTTSCTPQSGSLFAVGTNPVSCSTTDGLGRTASCSATVAVSRAQTSPPSNGGPNFVADVSGATTGVRIFQSGGGVNVWAIVAWASDNAADSQVEYGTSTSYGMMTVLDSTLVTSHSMVLNGLTTGTTYHYRVRSRNAAGGLSISQDATFATPAGQQSAQNGSSSGTQAAMVPPLAQISDSNGNVWTLGPSGQTLRNGVQMGGGIGSKLLIYNASVYALGTDSYWWQWAGSSWRQISQTQPGAQSASSALPMVPPLAQIVDGNGDAWTLGPAGQTLRNGVQMGGGIGTKLIWYNSYIYTLGRDNFWWQWVNNSWRQISQTQPGGGTASQ